MNTSAINSPLAALTPAANNNKQDAFASSEAGAFNQVLTREIAGRNNTGNTNEASGTSDAEKTGTDEKATSVADGKKDDADAIVAGPSAELLAFVAVLTQTNTASAQIQVTDAAAETAASTKITDNDATLDTALGVNTTITTGSEEDAIGKKSDFVAALDKATTATSDNTTSVATVSTAALQQLADTTAVQSSKLAPQVGSPGWNQALGQKIVWMVQGAQQTATLTLNPPDLGPLQVTLNVSNNQATANFTAHQPEVRQALEAAMPRLREMLNDAGIQLNQSNVSAGTPNQQNAFSEQRQGGRQSSSNTHSNEAEPVIHVSHVAVPTIGNGIVDTFA